jgi:hypothetical protein
MACEPRKARRLLDWGGPHKTVIVMDMGAAGQAKVYDLDAAVFPRVPSLLRELKGHDTPGWFSPVQVIGRGGGTGDDLPRPAGRISPHPVPPPQSGVRATHAWAKAPGTLTELLLELVL